MEGSDEDGRRSGLSRLDLLRRAGIVGVAAAVPAGALTRDAASGEQKVEAAVEREALESLTASEADTLDAIVSRLIPSDGNGPGAREARVTRFIDRRLKGELSQARDTYTNGLAELDAYAKRTYGAEFVNLTAAQQDAILTNMEANTATGFTPNSRAVFNTIRNHAVQGMFSDPFHGGNANFAGWDLIGYPGIKIRNVTAAEQALDTQPRMMHRSTYDYDMFKREPARRSGSRQRRGNHHGGG